jgi:hypothetical protein
MPSHFEQWESLAELLAHVKQRPAMENVVGAASMSETGFYGEPRWTLGLGFGAAVKLAEEGWREMVERASGVAKQVEADWAETTRDDFVMTWDVAGDEPDVGRFVAGDPENMVEMVLAPVPTTGRVVRILVNGSFSAAIKSDEIVRFGAAIVAMVEILRTRGLSPEVWVESTAGGRRNCTYTVLTKVHAASAVLDIGNIMFPIAHPAFLRRIIFADMEMAGHKKPALVGTFNIGSGYGSAHQPTKAEAIGAHMVLGNTAMRRSADPVSFIRHELSALGLIED